MGVNAAVIREFISARRPDTNGTGIMILCLRGWLFVLPWIWCKPAAARKIVGGVLVPVGLISTRRIKTARFP